MGSGTADAKEQAAGALRSLASLGHQVAIGAAGGIAPLVELARSGPANAKEEAECALGILASNDGNHR